MPLKNEQVVHKLRNESKVLLYWLCLQVFKIVVDLGVAQGTDIKLRIEGRINSCVLKNPSPNLGIIN